MSGQVGRLLASLAVPVFFTLAGLGLTALLPALRARHPAVRAAYAYVLGLAWVAGAAYLLAYLLGVPLTRGLFVALGLVGGSPALARRKEGTPRRPPRAHRSIWDAAALFVGGLVSLGVMAEAVTNPSRTSTGSSPGNAGPLRARRRDGGRPDAAGSRLLRSNPPNTRS